MGCNLNLLRLKPSTDDRPKMRYHIQLHETGVFLGVGPFESFTRFFSGLGYGCMLVYDINSIVSTSL